MSRKSKICPPTWKNATKRNADGNFIDYINRYECDTWVHFLSQTSIRPFLHSCCLSSRFIIPFWWSFQVLHAENHRQSVLPNQPSARRHQNCTKSKRGKKYLYQFRTRPFCHLQRGNRRRCQTWQRFYKFGQCHDATGFILPKPEPVIMFSNKSFSFLFLLKTHGRCFIRYSNRTESPLLTKYRFKQTLAGFSGLDKRLTPELNIFRPRTRSFFSFKIFLRGEPPHFSLFLCFSFFFLLLAVAFFETVLLLFLNRLHGATWTQCSVWQTDRHTDRQTDRHTHTHSLCLDRLKCWATHRLAWNHRLKRNCIGMP